MRIASILVVGDELEVIQTCKLILSKIGHEVDSALSIPEAVATLEAKKYDILIFDLKLAGGELLERMKEAYPSTVVIILHGQASIAASEVLGYGVYDYLPKPVNSKELLTVMNRSLQIQEMLRNAFFPDEVENIIEFEELIGTGSAMKSLYNVILKVAPASSPVLLIGLEGTGKRLAARAVHQISTRRSQKLIELYSSQNLKINASRSLFGYCTGYGIKTKFHRGLIEKAGSGSIYIDEIAHLDHWGQRQLISAISKRVYFPYNGSDPRDAICRFILGTSRNPKVSLQTKEIISDLYLNLDVFPVYLPSLAERSQDIPMLAYNFLRKYKKRYRKNIEFIDDLLLTRLISTPWRENIIQLDRCIEQMVIICKDDTLTFDNYFQVTDENETGGWTGNPPVNASELKEIKKKLRREIVRKVEKNFILEALRKSNGNITQAALSVDMKRQNFQAMMRKCDI
ncbi:sigma-54-dependent Fis family transcriptional regulator [bacterium]|nr:sigma-54-dependent Fis family transcriptional regulator [bacterium]